MSYVSDRLGQFAKTSALLPFAAVFTFYRLMACPLPMNQTLPHYYVLAALRVIAFPLAGGRCRSTDIGSAVMQRNFNLYADTSSDSRRRSGADPEHFF